MSTFRIEKLNIHPLKSAQAFSIQEAVVNDSGLEGDRICALINEKQTVLTGRECPKILSISVTYTGSNMIVTAHGQEELNIDLENCPKTEIEAQLFREPFKTWKVNGKSSEWFSKAIGQECHLILNNPQHSRTIRHIEGENPITLSDACPIHLINQNSVDDLSKRLGNTVDSARFRPNILISGIDPYEEENWKEVHIGNLGFKVVLKTKRCTMITIDPKTQEKDPETEPLRELATYKRDGGKVNFGIYLVPQGNGKIKTSDPCKVYI